MLFILNFDIKDSGRMDSFIQALSEIGECLLYMPRCYFLKTNNLSGNQIYEKLKSVLHDEDLIVVVPAEVSQMQGWLSTSTVAWLKNV